MNDLQSNPVKNQQMGISNIKTADNLSEFSFSLKEKMTYQ
jgi:hypothetical protein